MGNSQFSSGTEGCPGSMAEGFVAEARRSSKHIGCRPSSMACPEVATDDHMGSIGEEEGALSQLEVTAGNPHDISELPPSHSHKHIEHSHEQAPNYS